MRECEHLLYTDPSDMLPADRILLDIDFDALGGGPAIARQTWRSEMQAAAHPDDAPDGHTPPWRHPLTQRQHSFLQAPLQEQ